jgi:hypothetical protein
MHPSLSEHVRQPQMGAMSDLLRLSERETTEERQVV